MEQVPWLSQEAVQELPTPTDSASSPTIPLSFSELQLHKAACHSPGHTSRPSHISFLFHLCLEDSSLSSRPYPTVYSSI